MTIGHLQNHMRLQAQMLGEQYAKPRLGLISAYDPNTYAAKVRIQPDDVETGWLPVLTPWVGAGWGLHAPPTPGDGRPVVVLTETMYRPEGNPVPAGFQTDFFSIPCPVIEIWPAFAPGCEYAVGHDWDCHNNVDKAVRSLRLYYGLISAGVNPLNARIIYLAALDRPVRDRPGGDPICRTTQRPGATRSSDTPSPGFHQGT